MKKIDLTLVIILSAALSIVFLLMPWLSPITVGNITGVQIISANSSFYGSTFLRVLIILFSIANCIIPFITLTSSNKKLVKFFLQTPFVILILISIFLLQTISSEIENHIIHYTSTDMVFIGLFNILQKGYWACIITASILMFFARKFYKTY